MNAISFETKVCRLCDKEKSIYLFEKDKRHKTGITSRCRDCKTSSNSKAAKAFRRLYEKQAKYPIAIETERQEFDVIFDLMSDVCSYCGEQYAGTPTIDHINALNNGGRHHISNITLVCKSCNSAKNDKPLLVFYEQNVLKFPEENLIAVIKLIAYFSDRTFNEVVADLEEQKRKYCAEKGIDCYRTDFIHPLPDTRRTRRTNNDAIA